jgi:hypothetical protein
MCSRDVWGGREKLWGELLLWWWCRQLDSTRRISLGIALLVLVADCNMRHPPGLALKRSRAGTSTALSCKTLRMVESSISSRSPSPRLPFPRSRSAPEPRSIPRPTHPEARPGSMASALDTFISYLRVPILASSGVAALLSGLLYFKQKYSILVPF